MPIGGDQAEPGPLWDPQLSRVRDSILAHFLVLAFHWWAVPEYRSGSLHRTVEHDEWPTAIRSIVSVKAGADPREAGRHKSMW